MVDDVVWWYVGMVMWWWMVWLDGWIIDDG